MKKLLTGLLVLGSFSSFASGFEVTTVSGRLYKSFEYPNNAQLYNGCSLVVIATYSENKRQQVKGNTSKEIWELDLKRNNDRCLYNSPFKINSFNDYVVGEKF